MLMDGNSGLFLRLVLLYDSKIELVILMLNRSVDWPIFRVQTILITYLVIFASLNFLNLIFCTLTINLAVLVFNERNKLLIVLKILKWLYQILKSILPFNKSLLTGKWFLEFFSLILVDYFAFDTTYINLLTLETIWAVLSLLISFA